MKQSPKNQIYGNIIQFYIDTPSKRNEIFTFRINNNINEDIMTYDTYNI